MERHEEEAEEIQVHGGHAEIEELLIFHEDGKERAREQEEDEPHERHVDDADDRRERHRVPDAPILSCAQIIADDGLRGVRQPLDGQRDDVSQGVERRHDADIHIAEHDAAHALQGRVAGDLHGSVGGVHHKARRAERNDALQNARFGLEILFAEAERRLLSAEEKQHPRRRDCLREDGRDGGALDAEAEGEDEEGVERDVDDRSRRDRYHAVFGVALHVDEAVHARCEHHERRADEIDVEVFRGVGVRCVARAEEIEDGLHEGIAQRHHEEGAAKQRREGVAHDLFGVCRLVTAPIDGAEGRAARAEEVGEGEHERHDGEGEPQPREGVCGIFGEMPDVDAVDKVVEHLHEHGNGHRHGEPHDVFSDASL